MSARATLNPANARRWWAMTAISLSVLVVGLDLTVLSLALPTLAASLHASTGDLQWIYDSYTLVLAALMLPAGLLGDRYGRRRIMLFALAVFVASSVWCAYSTGVGELIAARAVLGVAAAAIFPLAISVIPVMFGEEERQKAIAVMSAAIFVSYPIGPILGGFLLDHFWWGSVFLINVPIVAAALVAVVFLLPESRAQRRPSLDFPGIAISSAGLTVLTYGFIRAGEQGWTDAIALAAMPAGVVLLALFVAWERRAARRGGGQPLVDLPLFRLAGFSWGTILMTCVSFAMMGLMFTVPQYFQDVRGATPLGSGVRLLPLIGGLMVGMIAGSRLSDDRKGPAGEPFPPLVSARAMVTAGFAVMAAGLVTGASTGPGSPAGFAELWITLVGLGLGMVFPSAMNAALAPLTGERSGSGSALISAIRQVGATIGVAVLGTLLSNGYASRLPDGLPSAVASTVRGGVAGGVAAARKLGSPGLLDVVRSAFIHGMGIMLWTCGGIAAASALLALAFLPRRPAGSRAPSGRRRGRRSPVRHPRPASPPELQSGNRHNEKMTTADLSHHKSLRERKKAKTRAAIREHALRLFREQGYGATTVEQIAAAAEVSPSTFFRYFPTKEDVVLQDDMDTRMVEAFARQPRDIPPIAAVRAATRDAWNSFTAEEWAQIREGARLSLQVPEIRARTMNEFARSISVIAETLASRVGRDPDDLRVRVFAGAVVGAMMAVFLPGKPDRLAIASEAEAEADADAVIDPMMGPDAAARIDEALALLEQGLPL